MSPWSFLVPRRSLRWGRLTKERVAHVTLTVDFEPFKRAMHSPRKDEA